MLRVLPESVLLSVLVLDCFATVGAGVFLVLVELSMREVLVELARLPELAVACFCALGGDGVFFPISLPIR